MSISTPAATVAKGLVAVNAEQQHPWEVKVYFCEKSNFKCKYFRLFQVTVRRRGRKGTLKNCGFRHILQFPLLYSTYICIPSVVSTPSRD